MIPALAVWRRVLLFNMLILLSSLVVMARDYQIHQNVKYNARMIRLI